MTSIKIKKNHAEICDDVRIHNEPDEKDLITAQVLITFLIIVCITFLIGLAIGGFYF